MLSGDVGLPDISYCDPKLGFQNENKLNTARSIAVENTKYANFIALFNITGLRFRISRLSPNVLCVQVENHVSDRVLICCVGSV